MKPPPAEPPLSHEVSLAACWAIVLAGWFCIGVGMFMLFGLVPYDGPIRPCAATTGYCSKTGTPRTVAQLRTLERNERIFFGLVPVAGLLMFAASAWAKHSTKR